MLILMAQKINKKKNIVIIWWEQWELTRWNSLSTPCLENICGIEP